MSMAFRALVLLVFLALMGCMTTGQPGVGQRFRDCLECPELVVVPAGSFLMGSPDAEEGRDEDEGPVHRVTFAVPFAVGVHEVTVSQFGRFVDETGYSTGDSCWTYEEIDWREKNGRSWRDPGFGQDGAYPVVCVIWDDALAYVAWLSGLTGREYRLPSESEWEYAARAGTATPFHTGATISTDQANYDGNYVYGNGRQGAYRERTLPVGSFPANGFGLHDVHGNVGEWVQDCWSCDYEQAPSDGSAWEGGDCSTRVLRGGAWMDLPRDLRSATRARLVPGGRSYIGGFRVARTLTP